MTLLEMSSQYADSARKLSARLRVLRAMARQTQDAQTLFELKQRIAVLTEVLTQTNDLAKLTAHYYERGYWRNENYTL